MTAQSLEWLQLIASAHGRQRTEKLLDASTAARAGQVTQEGFKDFIHQLKNESE